MDLPKWKSHKVVEAFKISNIEVRIDGWAEMAGKEGELVVVDRDYRTKHLPMTGGYYVRYKNGYESWSPAQAFEEGYSRIEVSDE